MCWDKFCCHRVRLCPGAPGQPQMGCAGLHGLILLWELWMGPRESPQVLWTIQLCMGFTSVLSPGFMVPLQCVLAMEL